jgi:hypothetical protein
MYQAKLICIVVYFISDGHHLTTVVVDWAVTGRGVSLFCSGHYDGCYKLKRKRDMAVLTKYEQRLPKTFM